jgi:hypothetical protein
MGLDQYLFVQETEGSDPEEKFYWRKHPNLQGFMEREWRKLPESQGDFNCAPLVITPEILERLEVCIHPSRATDALPNTSGFFFGKSDGYYDDQDRQMLEFCKGALAKGHKITYDSWW